MSASPRKDNLLTFDNHPILVRLLMSKVSMWDICFPDCIPTTGPFDWNLKPGTKSLNQKTQKISMPLQQLQAYSHLVP